MRLRYLCERKVGSDGSRRSYGYYLAAFCQAQNVTDPDALVERSPQELAALVNSFLRRQTSWTSHYKNTVLSYLLMHFKCNGFRDGRSLIVRNYHVPRRFRANPEHIPSSGEIWKMSEAADSYGRALVLFLYYTGLRVSTVCAVQYGDIKSEFESGIEPLFIPVFPSMKQRVAGACKGNVPYYSFVKGHGFASLRKHLDLVKKRLGESFTEKNIRVPAYVTKHPNIGDRDEARKQASHLLCSEISR